MVVKLKAIKSLLKFVTAVSPLQMLNNFKIDKGANFYYATHGLDSLEIFIKKTIQGTNNKNNRGLKIFDYYDK